jgi:hypothetical protein
MVKPTCLLQGCSLALQPDPNGRKAWDGKNSACRGHKTLPEASRLQEAGQFILELLKAARVGKANRGPKWHCPGVKVTFPQKIHPTKKSNGMPRRSIITELGLDQEFRLTLIEQWPPAFPFRWRGS